jgi:DNA-binding MurR/RpiR family transcriptional regulator
VEHAIAKGTSVISLTDRENSPITAKRGLTLIFGVESPWIYNSITASLVLAQVLVAETLVLSGNDALRRINKRERLFQTFAVFEK